MIYETEPLVHSAKGSTWSKHKDLVSDANRTSINKVYKHNVDQFRAGGNKISTADRIKGRQIQKDLRNKGKALSKRDNSIGRDKYDNIRESQSAQRVINRSLSHQVKSLTWNKINKGKKLISKLTGKKWNTYIRPNSKNYKNLNQHTSVEFSEVKLK